MGYRYENEDVCWKSVDFFCFVTAGAGDISWPKESLKRLDPVERKTFARLSHLRSPSSPAVSFDLGRRILRSLLFTRFSFPSILLILRRKSSPETSCFDSETPFQGSILFFDVPSLCSFGVLLFCFVLLSHVEQKENHRPV